MKKKNRTSEATGTSLSIPTHIMEVSKGKDRGGKKIWRNYVQKIPKLDRKY